jgi:hypothetical protein
MVISRSADIVTASRECDFARAQIAGVGDFRVDAGAGQSAKIPKFACKA